jgi:hypothetical protein
MLAAMFADFLSAHDLTAQLPSALLLFIYALIFAMVEIEIEGPDGWAEKLPTWYRVTPWYARVFSRAIGGKPLTGYHATMIPLALLSFHVGFAFGQPWSIGAEAEVLARFGFWTIVWDALWFVLNPAFGWQRFRPGQVWWLGRVWIGPFPVEYWTALASSFVVAALPALLGARVVGALVHHAAFCALQIALGLLVGLAAPAYQRWYRYMRRPGSDERPLVFKR